MNVLLVTTEDLSKAVDLESQLQKQGFFVNRCELAEREPADTISLLTEMICILKELNKNWERLSLTDALTDIPNRRCFDEYIEREWKRAIRQSESVSLLLIDVDFFKKFNDEYGHPRGDECLQEIAFALKDSIQRPGDLVARFGGEEFAVILPNTKSEGAAVLAERMRKNIENLHLTHSGSPSSSVTVSIGVATAETPTIEGYEWLLLNADRALYCAKENGRNQIAQSAFHSAKKVLNPSSLRKDSGRQSKPQ